VKKRVSNVQSRQHRDGGVQIHFGALIQDRQALNHGIKKAVRRGRAAVVWRRRCAEGVPLTDPSLRGADFWICDSISIASLKPEPGTYEPEPFFGGTPRAFCSEIGTADTTTAAHKARKSTAFITYDETVTG
jgi:hypothetical protein